MPTRDAWAICAAAFLRSAVVGAVGVFLAITLANRGYAISTIGVLIGVGLAGATVMTAVVGAMADRIGRRRTLIVVAMLSALGYAGLALAEGLAWLLPIAFVGMVNGMGRDRGPAGALEQAMLPETTDARGRTWVIAWYNLVIDAAHALGALGAVLPRLMVSALDTTPSAAYRMALLMCAGVVAFTIAAYLLLSAGVEVQEPRLGSRLRLFTGRPGRNQTGRSRDQGVTAFTRPELPDLPVSSFNNLETPELRSPGTPAVRRLAVLFGIDSLGGGLLSSALIAYWFLHRYGLSETQLAALFFAARVLNALSHLGAAWLARRIGLLNTMVFTHLPSSVLLMSAPLAPSAPLAAALFLGREGLVEMDVPTRQSYVMAIVPPSARTYASAVTNVTRTGGWAAGAAIAGLLMQHVVLSGPLFVAGALKIGYDLMLYRSFRHVKPPEEM